MSEHTYRSSPYVSPDTVRQKLHLDQSLYELHTKRYFGREDINGLQYVGTVENFGSEMLLETRKLRMLRPPLNDIICNQYMQKYFRLEYADEIDTYNQQNLIACILKKDVLLSYNDNVFREARIVFQNIKRKRILRSRYLSDDKVVNRLYFETSTIPVLKYYIGSDVYEYPLSAYDVNGNAPTYYFALTINCVSLNGVFDGEITDDEWRRTFIDPDMSSDDTLYTLPLTDDMCDIPFIWMTLPMYRTLPSYSITGNVDGNQDPLLEIGTNGHFKSYLYPMAYSKDNLPPLPSGVESDLKGWSIRVFARNNQFVDGEYPDTNLNVDIEKIQFIYGIKLSYRDPVTEEGIHNLNTFTPDYVYTMTIPENEHVRITLTDYDQFNWSKDIIRWRFRRAKEDEWDYDGMLFKNPVYAYLYDIDSFFCNNSWVGLRHVYTPQIQRGIQTMYHLFEVKFDHAYWEQFGGMIENAVSGIHIDYTSDFTEHAVDKKNGTIHEFGDFDGLPYYYSNYQTRDTKRPRVTLYANRDNINSPKHDAMNQQTAALFVDGSIPQRKLQDVSVDLTPIIHYAYGRLYRTIGEPESIYNSASDMIWIKGRRISDTHNEIYEGNTHNLIYHGNRSFSLSVIGLNPVNEIARVYSATNDPAYYENNGASSCKKPERTMARICDIPTEYSQITHISGISPTFIMDPYYIHSDCDYTIDDQDRIWNLNRDDHYAYGQSPLLRRYVFEDIDDLDEWISPTYLENHYSRLTNLNAFMDMRRACKTSLTPEDYVPGVGYHWTIVNPGENYVNGSVFMFYIGGIATVGDVLLHSTPSYSPAEDYVNRYDEKRLIHIANLSNRDQEYNTTVTRKCGSGMTLRIDIDDDVWDSLQPTSTLLSNIYTYKKDASGNLWTWNYINGSWQRGTQLTGPIVYENIYDEESSRDDRQIVPAMMHNILQKRPCKQCDADAYHEIASITYIPIEDYMEDIDTFDVSNLLHQYGLNYQESYFTLTKSIFTAEVTVYQSDNPGGNDEVTMLPKNHMYTEYEHFNKTNTLVADMELVDGIYQIPNDKQPTLSVYSPYVKTIVETDDVASDVHIWSYERDITFMDVSSSLITFDVDEGRLSKTIYRYDGYQIPEQVQNLNSILNGSVDTMLAYILRVFGEDSEPIRYRDTVYAYTQSMLRNYILQNIDYQPTYCPNMKQNLLPIKRYRAKGDIVVEKRNTTYVGIGEQPSGRYIEATSTIYHSNMHAQSDQTTLIASPLFVFRLDTIVSDLNLFRMYDDMTGDDISEYVLLVYNHALYIFDKTYNMWRQIIHN